MRVHDITSEPTADGWRLSAAIGDSALAGRGERLHFTVHGASAPWSVARGDAFLAATLMPAMALGEELVVDGPVSPRLRRTARTVMDICCAWWGDRHGPVVLRCSTAAPAAGAPGAGVGLYVTCGVDSLYSLLKDVELSRDPAHEPVTHLLYANFERHEGPAYERLLRRLRRVAGETFRPLVLVDTNVRSLTEETVFWPDYHGAALASVALALQELLGRCLVASSATYVGSLRWGSSPVLDHLWPTEGLEMVHDGAEASRTEKVMRHVATSPLALQTLSVCWRSDPAHNCGACEKCLRTMVALELAGCLDRCATLPHALDLDALRDVELSGEGQLNQMRAIRVDAARLGRPEIAAAIDAVVHRYADAVWWRPQRAAAATRSSSADVAAS